MAAQVCVLHDDERVAHGNPSGLSQPFASWGEEQRDPTTTSAMIDRIVHHADVINLKGTSYRLKHHYPAATTAQQTT